jgi:hypothetical protein
MQVFFTQLVAALDADRPDWRNDTIILLDNASYHKSATLFDLFAHKGIPVMFTGPHSYSACPCEVSITHEGDQISSNSNLITPERHQIPSDSNQFCSGTVTFWVV